MKKEAIINLGKIAYKSKIKTDQIFLKAQIMKTTSEKPQDANKLELRFSCFILKKNNKRINGGYEDLIKLAEPSPLVKELREMWNALVMRPKTKKEMTLIETIDFNRDLKIYFKDK